MKNHGLNLEAALRTAQHEAGHALAAELFGCEIVVTKVNASGYGGTGITGFRESPNLTSAQRRIVGLAGLAAELLLHGHNVTPDELVSTANDAQQGLGSDDRALTGSVDHALAAETLALLSPYATTIRRRAVALVAAAQDRKRGVVRL